MIRLFKKWHSYMLCEYHFQFLFCDWLYCTLKNLLPACSYYGNVCRITVLVIVRKYRYSKGFNFVRFSLNKDIDYSTACSEYDGLNTTQFCYSVDKRSYDWHRASFLQYTKLLRSWKRFFVLELHFNSNSI